MSGFPVRPARSAFGPDPENRRPVRNPKLEISADIFKLAFWQLAGMGLMVPQAWVYCTISGTTLTLASHAESWDPNQALAVPGVTRTSQGLYAVAYPATVPDENGDQRAISLTWGIGCPQTSSSRFGIAERVDAQHFNVRVRDDAGAVQDANFAALFW
jgi:hypothetical protein